MDRIAIVIADTAGIIQFWSKGAEEAFGHSAQDAKGQTLDLIVPEEFRDSHWSGFRRAMLSNAAAMEGRPSLFPVRGANGRTEKVSGKLTLLRAEDDSVVGAMVIFG